MSDAAGMIGGRYRLLRMLGKGGMGTVWQAHDEVLGRDVALKEILPPPDLTGPEREEFAVRTFREARAAGRVAHPGVAAVYDVLEEHDHPWIVMQLVPSRTLGEVIRDEGPLPPERVADIGLQLLEALRAAHAAGVLHRDVKPDNVLVAADGRAVLTDFGIATTEDEAPVTKTGVLIGTPAFMAPERAAGGQATPASDLWSLGVTLFMAVEGHSPFQRENALASLGAVMHSEPPQPARAGPLGPVLLGLLHKNPVRRMSLEEAERRLLAILGGGSSPHTRPLAVPRRAARRRRPPLVAFAAGVLAVAAATGGAAWWSSRPDDVPPNPRGSAPAVATTAPPTSTASAPASTPASAPASAENTEPDSEPTYGTAGPRTATTPPPVRQRSRTPTEEPRESRAPSPTASEEESQEESEDADTPSENPGRVEGSDGAADDGPAE
ncbi:serine/threonine-protein kinase [Nonomuraea jiangxiensis]|uniref:non-specific serine/threonine protein kinase n=1 Tax=Nonomuraea jiangxiensis TaxID=633440 RepID=A0A1G8HJ24_9ACTN|nr:serine/threonine-protein kinase [Nonomuraea jiangxiensis]SDI06450.1 Serine/threonine protein kinase [Nonomuraea jiangxiensis]